MRQALFAAMLLAAGLGSVAGAGATEVSRAGTIDIAGRTLHNFDIGWFDGPAHRCCSAELSNAAVDVIDTQTNASL